MAAKLLEEDNTWPKWDLREKVTFIIDYVLNEVPKV